MSTVRECVCCQEITLLSDRITSLADTHDMNVPCITQHPGFHTVCLDEWTLEAAYYSYRQGYRVEHPSGPRRNRYVAYRQFVRWCWGYLGKDVRVVLPSCVVTKIRNTFPSPDGTYIGFQY
ncbi:P2X purinoceptor 7-like [Gigantopelta aegis]|uniref:P2X purinoceptor 7-like n=1 Tax=Gigantopelta aegis TaxID=1735272 RepID=UPI001B887EFD|nr:P2X purinoceptor 7-like [Gigantopelta aegis]